MILLYRTFSRCMPEARLLLLRGNPSGPVCPLVWNFKLIEFLVVSLFDEVAFAYHYRRIGRIPCSMRFEAFNAFAKSSPSGFS